ncbi:hypothetical protein [Kitasatospora sp. NPDC059160]|uniref:hypothetical protein n=1 Tax=Kitasatospora sp. NPDC059160 TaxID=3346748 RepID=UPI0036CA5FB3
MSDNPAVRPPAEPAVNGFGPGRGRNRLLQSMAPGAVTAPPSSTPAPARPANREPAAPPPAVPAAPQPDAARVAVQDVRPAVNHLTAPAGPSVPDHGPESPQAVPAPAPEGLADDDDYAPDPEEGLTREVKPLLPLSVIARFEKFERRTRLPRAVILLDAIDHCHSTGVLGRLLAPQAVRPEGSLFPRRAPAHRRLPKTEKETQLSFRLTEAERAVIDQLVQEWSRKTGQKIPMSRLIAAALDGYLPKPKPKKA